MCCFTCNSRGYARLVAEGLRKNFEAGKDHELFQATKITVSIGIAELSKDEIFDNLLQRADLALYKAKKNGRNCCEVASGYT